MAALWVFVVLVCTCVQFLSCGPTPVYVYPEHVHLSYGETTHQMVVTWMTFKVTDSVVEYGKNKLTNITRGNVTVFSSEGHTRFIHRVTLENLEHGQKYYYHCGSELGWSDLFYFTNRRTDAQWAPKIAVFGDLGTVNAQSLPRLQHEVAMETIDAVLHVGDFAYKLDSVKGSVGDIFMQQIQPIAAYVPYMTAVGNHEAYGNFTHYKQRFSMPGDTQGMFYSFNLGLAHFVVINTEAYYFPTYGTDQIQTQYNWLKEDLRTANLPRNRARHPWIIVMGHRPMYCAIIAPLPAPHLNDCDSIRDKVRLGLEPFFYDHGVDLAMWAHEHEYQRIYPMYNYTLCKGCEADPYANPRATVHIISGSAGCDERHDKFLPKPDWVDKNIIDYGYTKLQVLNHTHLYLEQISDDRHGAVVDRLYIQQHYHRGFRCHLDENPSRVSRYLSPNNY